MQIKLYTRPGCTLCDYAKRELAKRNIPYQEVDISEQTKRDEVKKRFPEAKMLPVVVIDGTWIGGRDELIRYINKGLV